jgi:hypothetical protein
LKEFCFTLLCLLLSWAGFIGTTRECGLKVSQIVPYRGRIISEMGSDACCKYFGFARYVMVRSMIMRPRLAGARWPACVRAL